MADVCKFCGAELPDGAVFCPGCSNGRSADEEVKPFVPQEEILADAPEIAGEGETYPAFESAPVEETPKKKAVKWWMIAAPVAAVLLIAVLVAAVMWDAIYIRIAPTSVLAQALENTVTELRTRGEGAPLDALATAVGEDGQYTMETDVTMAYDTYMSIVASIVSRNDILNGQHQIDLDGSLDLMGYITYDLNAAVYLDRDQLAANWKQAFGDEFYGVTLDTVGEDVRGNSLLYNALDEETVAMLEEMADVYSNHLNMTMESMEGITPSEEYSRILTEFLKAHKPEVTSQTLSLSGEEKKCSRLTYTITDEELAALVEQLGAVLEEDQAVQQLLRSYYDANVALYDDAMTWEEYWTDYTDSITELSDTIRESGGTNSVSFCLYSDKVVYIDYGYASEDSDGSITLMFGKNPGRDDIELSFSCNGEDTMNLELKLSAKREETSIQETLSVHYEDESELVDMVLGYEWNKDNGDFILTFQGDDGFDVYDHKLDLKLYAEEELIRFVIPDMFALMASIEETTASYYGGYSMELSFSVYPGAEITAPVYTNIRDLTEADISEMGENISSNYGY